MNILQLSLLLAILLKSVIASESGVAQDVIQALSENEKEKGFESIKGGWRTRTTWRYRTDLFDHVVTKGVDFIVDFINQVKKAKIPTLAALFIKRPDEVDQVLKKIKYYDNDLISLTEYRPELAESHKGFFMVIDKINGPKNQEWAVGCGVVKLFGAKKYGSVISLIDALEKRQFNGRKLKDVAIQEAFKSGAKKDIKYIVERFHEHTAITSKIYAYGLIDSLEDDKSETFPFLLSQADQGDLNEVKEGYRYKKNPKFREAIDVAFPNAEPAGSRLRRPKERVELVKKTFDEIQGFDSLGREDQIGGIILSY